MKLKGINPIEQHVEKIVLGVFALILLGVFAWQFVGNPNAVQVGQQTVSPDKAPDIVRDMARQVKGKLESGTAPTIPPQPSVLAEVKAGLEGKGGVAKPVALAGVVGGASKPVVPTPGGGDQAGASAFAMFAPPPASGVVAAVHEGTIDPVVPVTIKEAAVFLPAQQPLDLRSVSVQASIDAAAVRAALSAPKEGQPLPGPWWQAKVEVLDVELQRETRQADGSWGAMTTIAPFPGAPSLRAKLRDPETRPVDLNTILETEKAQRESIRRPAYWATIAGAAWINPAEAAGSSAAGAPADVQAKVRLIKNNKEQINRLQAAIDGRPAGGPGGGNPPPPPPGGGGGGDGGDRDGPGGGGGGGGAGGPGGRPPQPPPGGTGGDNRPGRKAQLEKQRDDLQKAVDEAVTALKDKGYDEQGRKLESEAKAFAEPLTSITEAATQSVTVWAHDPSAKPGETYRYRVVAWFTNPLFGNANALEESQKAKAAAAAVASAPSEWSSPVTVEPSVRFVLTSSREAGGVGVGNNAIYSEASASGEVYEFYYGYWRKAAVNIGPGDRVAAELTLPVLNTFEIPVNDQGAPDLAAMKTTPINAKRTVALDEFFVDAQTSPGAGGNEAVMRASSGALVIRRTGDADAEALRDRLSASASAASSATVRTPGAASTPGAGNSGGGGGGGQGDRDDPSGTPPAPGGKPGGPPPRPGGKPGGD